MSMTVLRMTMQWVPTVARSRLAVPVQLRRPKGKQGVVGSIPISSTQFQQVRGLLVDTSLCSSRSGLVTATAQIARLVTKGRR